MRMLLLLLFPIVFLLQGCGNGPHIENPEKAAAIFNGANPVGVLEIQGTNSKDGFGFNLGYPYWRNTYCTAFLTDTGSIMTNSECLRASDKTLESADTRDMTLYMRNPNEKDTSKYTVRRIVTAKHESDQNWAVLEMDNAPGLIAKYNGIKVSETLPELEKVKKGLPAQAITISRPSNSGMAKIEIHSITIATQQKIAAYEKRMSAKKPSTGDATKITPPAKDSPAPSPTPDSSGAPTTGDGNSDAPIVDPTSDDSAYMAIAGSSDGASTTDSIAPDTVASVAASVTPAIDNPSPLVDSLKVLESPSIIPINGLNVSDGQIGGPILSGTEAVGMVHRIPVPLGSTQKKPKDGAGHAQWLVGALKPAKRAQPGAQPATDKSRDSNDAATPAAPAEAKDPRDEANSPVDANGNPAPVAPIAPVGTTLVNGEAVPDQQFSQPVGQFPVDANGLPINMQAQELRAPNPEMMNQMEAQQMPALPPEAAQSIPVNQGEALPPIDNAERARQLSMPVEAI